jgi:hypothetical protein
VHLLGTLSLTYTHTHTHTAGTLSPTAPPHGTQALGFALGTPQALELNNTQNTHTTHTNTHTYTHTHTHTHTHTYTHTHTHTHTHTRAAVAPKGANARGFGDSKGTCIGASARGQTTEMLLKKLREKKQ